ncbi:MAG: hypothetical protein J7M25_16700 [Deltaproteobacteria bacterium]|nr:hypothetical protein [Deltaproteobacteria bacterium]
MTSATTTLLTAAVIAMVTMVVTAAAIVALPLLVGASAFWTTGCSVDVPSTPHQKELNRERQLQSLIVKPDAAVPKSPKQVAHTVVVAMNREPRHLNPALKIGSWGYRVSMYTIYEPLIRRNPKTGVIEPWLASHWTISGDGRIYTFNIRKGVRWHDGRPLTAQDVWFSLSRVTDPRVPLGPFRMDVRDSLQRVDMPDPWTVRITLRTPNAFLLDHLTEYPIVSYTVFRKGMRPSSRGSRHPVGTGPFRFDSWKRADHIDLVRNESYWGRVPDIWTLRFRLIEDESKALIFLKRGEIDILPSMIAAHYPSQVSQRVRDHFQIVRFDAPGFAYILWNTRNRILSDFRVRRAMTILMDRKRLIKEVHHGLARLIVGPYWRPGGMGDPKLKPWPYDPIQARNLLDSAGWRDRNGDHIRDKDGVPMRIILLAPVQAPVLKAELAILSAKFAKSGIDLVYVPTDWPMMKRMLKRGRFMAAALQWAGRPAEDFSPLFHSAGRDNFGIITNLMLDQLLIRLRTTRKRARRGAISAKIEQILHSYQPVTFIHAPVVVALVHRRLKNVVLGPDWFDFGSMKVTAPKHEAIR